MDEVCYKLLWYVISDFFVFAFALSFLKLRFSRIVSIICIAFLLVVVAFTDFICFAYIEREAPFAAVWFTVAEILLVQATIFFLSDYRDGRGLFTGLASSNFSLLGFIFAGFIYALTDNYILSLSTLVGIDVLLLTLLSAFVKDGYLQTQSRGSTGWFSLCIIPSLFYLLFYTLSIMPVSRLQDITNYPTAIIALITMIVSYVVVLRYIANRSNESSRNESLALIEGYIKSLDIEINAIADEQKRLSILKHDVRHYYGILSVMLKEKEYESMQYILDEVIGEIDGDSVPFFSEDPILNSALQVISYRAAEHDIILRTSIVTPDMPRESQLRFAAITINLVENAIDAILLIPRTDTKVDRSVDIIIKPIKNQLFLEVKNPCIKTRSLLDETGLPISNRGQGHGFGLKSVREFAESYGGAFDHEHDGQCFTARLTIPL